MKVTDSSAKNPIKVAGTMTWIYKDGSPDDAAPVEGLIRGERDIVIDGVWDGVRYTIPLKSAEGIIFSGDFAASNSSNVNVRCKFWSNKQGYLLSGMWIEGGHEMRWTVELH